MLFPGFPVRVGTLSFRICFLAGSKITLLENNPVLLHTSYKGPIYNFPSDVNHQRTEP